MDGLLGWLLVAAGILLTSVGVRRLVGGGIRRVAAVSIGAGSFRFTGSDGQEHIATVREHADQLPPAGASVRIAYDPRDPSAARVENIVTHVFSWFFAGDVLIIIGILLILA